MKIVVCYKNVPDEQDITINQDKTLNFDQAPWKIGQYDLNAVEAGMQLAASNEGSQVLALTAGGPMVENSKLKKGILSRGPGKMFGVCDPRLEEADCYTIAAILKAAIMKIGGVDLILCGEGSGDLYAKQTGSLLGSLLQWPVLNGVQDITLSCPSKLLVKRCAEDGVETFEVTLPAVLTVTTDSNLPRIPTMKDILGAGKKPSELWSLDDLSDDCSSGVKTISILASEETDRKQVVFSSDSPDNIEQLYQQIRKLV